MTSPKCSLLLCDLKDPPAKPSTPVFGYLFRHLGLVSVTAGALLITYALINGLSAATNDAPAAAPEMTQPEIAGPLRHAQSRETKPIRLASLAPAQTPAVPTPAHEVSSPKPETANYAWTAVTVKPRDTLSRIFKRHGVKVKDAYAVAALKDAAVLKKIHPGAEIRLAADDAGALATLRYRPDAFTTLHVDRKDGRLRAEVITRTPEIKMRGEKATIWTNLLDAAKGVDVDFETVYALAQLFGWQVDFAREIRGGDQFSVIFEELYLDGKKVGNGDILAAELITSNRRLRALRHIDAQGHRTYYAPNGDGIQHSFLRSPLKFGRVTSRFSHKRFHPIFKKWRAHRGVDYGAPRGTPVLATGDGVIMRARHDPSYGKIIMIRHGEKYTTLYAHLHRLAVGMKSGARVKQGDVIGYVGNTGWVTGTHLHYEFRVDSIHRNPLTVKLPKSNPIAAEYLPEFLARAAAWVAQLEHIGALPPVAQIEGARSLAQ